MAKIDAFFKYMMENNCSDLHLSSGCKPMVRKHGELEEIKYQELTNEILEKLLFEIISDEQRDFF